MKNIFLSILLSISLTCFPFYAYAGETDPDDSLNIEGKLLYIGKGETTPFAGILFDIPAATKLKIDKQFMETKFKLELEFTKKKLQVEYDLKLSNLQLKHDALKSKTDSLLKIKNEELNRLQDLIKENPNDYSHWWFSGGIVAGILLSMGIYYAAVQVSK